jgi:soluble lytic murein transglycosylase-like protein
MSELYSTTSTTQPGYFRIGFVVLQIPPSDISTNKVVNDDQVSTLRTSTPMFVKSGQSRWDVTVHWKAIRFVLPESADSYYDNSQWEDLQKIVAIFRAAPFVEVENAFLRQHFTTVQPAFAIQRMAFALKQLRIDTDPSSSNILDVTLTMSLFNYAPYSIAFDYKGNSMNASDSPDFENFITSWIIQNITNHPLDRTCPPLLAWDAQDDGVMGFMWRQYIMYPISTDQPPAQSNSSVGYTSSSSSKTTKPSALKGQLSSDIQAIVNSAAAAAKPQVPSALATALCLAESSGNPNAGRDRVGAGLGLFQLVASTFKGISNGDIWDPTTNATAGCQYLANQYKIFGNWPQALAAYNVGPGAVKSYITGIPLHTKRGIINQNGSISDNGIPPNGTSGENVQNYVQKILAAANMSNLVTTAPVKSTDNTPPKTQTAIILPEHPTQAFIDLTNKIIADGALPPGVWHVDHWTEQGIFFYQENSFSLATADLGGGDYNMFPSQISVVFVNNLPLIPLAAMQYPTFQHVGPTDTLISISFDSVGDSESITLYEPEHEGLEAMVSMHNQMQEQFHQLRNTFRSVSSIHRMQAVFIQNQVINLLGIQGTMIRGINTETVPESTDLIQINLLASQYENVFEDTSPYTMNGIPKAYSLPLKNILTSGQLNQLTEDEKKVLTLVTEFADAWTKKDPIYLLSEMLKFSKEQVNFIGNMNTPSANLNPTQQNVLLGQLDKSGAAGSVYTGPGAGIVSSVGSYLRDTYPGLDLRRQQLLNTKVDMTFADYFIFSQIPNSSNASDVKAIRSTTEAAFVSQEQSIYNQMYSSLLDLECLNNGPFSRQISQIPNSPLFKSQFSSVVNVNGPALQKDSSGNLINEGHVCYKDLGLLDIGKDPADYFVP